MDQRYNLYNLEASFKDWLGAGIEKTQNNADPEEYQGQSTRKGLTKISIKNYLSDLRHFFGWLYFSLKSNNLNISLTSKPEEILRQINKGIINAYQSYLIANQIPIKTINRRLSTLRKFFTFCISQGWLKENPAKKIQNLKFTLEKREQNDNSKFKINSIISSFALSLEKENLNQNTIKSYLEVVQEFLNL